MPQLLWGTLFISAVQKWISWTVLTTLDDSIQDFTLSPCCHEGVFCKNPAWFPMRMLRLSGKEGETLSYSK